MIGLIRIVGIRFKRAGKIYYFDPGDMDLQHGDQVVVETASGLEFGDVVVPPKFVPDDEVVQPIRKVVRQVGGDDHEQLVNNRYDEREAQALATERIEAHGLPMRLVNTEYTFDRNRLTFFFTAENRVDFRALVHDLAKQFGVRIELRQIGVRDEAKEVGGIGVCGRELCCTSWMGEFAPVSIRMAKQQRLSLNPSKLTGQCGRLKCCLKFENDTYRQVRALLPEQGDKVALVVAAGVHVADAVGMAAGAELSVASSGRVVARADGNGVGSAGASTLMEGVVREVLITRESVLVDFGDDEQRRVSLKEIESGEAIVLTGKLARGGRGGGAADASTRKRSSDADAPDVQDAVLDRGQTAATQDESPADAPADAPAEVHVEAPTTGVDETEADAATDERGSVRRQKAQSAESPRKARRRRRPPRRRPRRGPDSTE